MKVRKLAVALALAGGLGSGVAQALGLGEIELQSYLNQPLNAEIDVRRAQGISPDEIIVNLASERAYERVGLNRDFFLSRLNFNVTTDANGELVISVTSSEPVREPYLNFLVEVTWPSGRVMREYSLLIDPPVYAEDSGVEEPVQAARTERRTAQPQGRQQQPPETVSRDAGQGRTLGPTTSSDTLWTIAQRVRPDSSVSMNQVMLALQDLNPDAFIDGNINRLKRGEVLRVPDMEDIRARSQAQATREVAAQNRAFAQPAREVDATDQAVADTGDTGTAPAGASDELRLVVPQDGEATRTEGSAGGDGRQGGTADAGRAVALEELDRVQRENEELNSRLEDLQDQVETLQRLIELKDSQLAEIQGSVAAEEQAAPAGDGPVTPDDMTADETGEAAEQDAAADATPDEDVQAPATEDAEPAPDAGQQEPEAEAAETPAAEGTETSPTAEPDVEVTQPAETGEAPAAATEAQPEPTASADPEKGLVARAIELIAGNFMYQIALGGFLVLLLLLVLLVSRRSGGKDKDFYRQLDEETGEDEGGFELSLGEEDLASETTALEEADRYVSYGQHDAAVEVLENAISREPSRSDLRLKLLAVYADTGNRSAFDKQYAELEAMEMDEAMPEAQALRARLEEMESTPSIDELESQLRGDSGFSAYESPASESTQPPAPSDEQANELIAGFEELDLPEEENRESDWSGPDEAIEFDISGLAHETPDRQSPPESELPAEPAGEEGEESLADIDFEFPEEEEASEADVSDQGGEEPLNLEDNDDFSSLELDDAGFDSEPAPEDVQGAADLAEEESALEFDDTDLETGDLDLADSSVNPEDEADLDESFLDELDAELDRVEAGQSAEPSRASEDSFDDLELDVSDEDLALMDQVSESEPEDESRLDLDDLDLDEAGTTEGDIDDLSDLEIPELDSDDLAEEKPVEGASTAGKSSGMDIDEMDEASLGDDDDFDFLSGTDEVATKLDLARAYVDMGDSEGAREILEEVILEGTDEQKSDAQSLLKKLP
ncbi:pilus assembly protein FimV [Marinobacter daqiaonensis]|uniref:Pilus assembly protein FimV n=1 Tax=Marinobacter daqiaonensis TaxID=650891 RepID=A0A1I6GWA8_9GAMM|nr:FimV/HubP family polar landmark protein [Marinobacter daqiaonensis]SFR46436.1 pilus assembly protein FimV [Marinobacter daqiaonensis]